MESASCGIVRPHYGSDRSYINQVGDCGKTKCIWHCSTPGHNDVTRAIFNCITRTTATTADIDDVRDMFRCGLPWKSCNLFGSNLEEYLADVSDAPAVPSSSASESQVATDSDAAGKDSDRGALPAE